MADNSASGASGASAPEASASKASAAFDPTIFPTDITIPIYGPYEFEDGFIFHTESELRAMSFEQLAAYGSTVSTSAGLEQSTINGNELLFSQYDILSQISQSTIDGLGIEIATNNADFNADIAALNILTRQSTIDYSTLGNYDSTISTQQAIMYLSQSTIEGLNDELSTLNSTFSLEDEEYISSARGYSTLYYYYEGLKQQLVNKIEFVYGDEEAAKQVLENANREIQYYTLQSGGSKGFVGLVSSAILAEADAFNNYLVSTATWKSVSEQLSTLNDENIAINSTITQYVIDEAEAEQEYLSTVLGVSTLSSLYKAAKASEDYAFALSSLTIKAEAYADALLTFDQADYAYTNSLPSGAQGGGKTPKKGGAASGAASGANSALWAARSMAQQALQAAEAEKDAASQYANTLQTLAEVAETDLYDVTLYALEQTVMNRIRQIDRLESQRLSTMEGLTNWSSIYERATTDYTVYDGLLSQYSTLYDSSIIGNSTLQGLADADNAEIGALQQQADGYSAAIATLDREYDENLSSMAGWSTLSSIYMEQYWSSIYGLSTLSSIYYNLGESITEWNNSVSDRHITNIRNRIDYFLYSSIRNSEIINLEVYDTQVKDNINQEERFAYVYKNTYCRERRLIYQDNYKNAVMGAIETASNATRDALATARLTDPNATVIPTPVNLTAPNVMTPYNKLDSMNTFLNTFTNIYSAYDTQTSNIDALSTNVGHKKEAWSTFSYFNDKEFYSMINETNPDVLSDVVSQTIYDDKDINTPLPRSQYQTLANTAFTQYRQTQTAVNTAKGAWSNQQIAIAALKGTFRTDYSQFFTAEEIDTQDTNISSFTIAGIQAGIAALAANGITFTM
jgi:hypothetical protein